MDNENNFCRGEEKRSEKRRKIFGEEKYFFAGRRRSEREKEENIMEKENLLLNGTDGSKALQEVLANLNQKNLLF